jgi:hypothetical protein
MVPKKLQFGQVIPTPSSTHDPLLRQGVVFAMGYTVNLATSQSTEESAGSGYRDDFHGAKLENPMEYGIPYGFIWFHMVSWNMEYGIPYRMRAPQ